jgi:hypothetical protein
MFYGVLFTGVCLCLVLAIVECDRFTKEGHN